MHTRPTTLALFALCALTFAGGCSPSEQPADVANPQRLNDAHFRLNYPGNWSHLTAGAKAQRVATHTFKSTGACTLTLVLHTLQEASPEDLKRFARAQTQTLLPKPAGERTGTFTTWGRYTGQGEIYKGKVLNKTATVKVFIHNRDKRSFMVLEQCLDEARPAVEPGFKLIADSFNMSPLDLSKLRGLKGLTPPKLKRTPKLAPKKQP